MIEFQGCTKCRKCKNYSVQNDYCIACQTYQFKDAEITKLKEQINNLNENMKIIAIVAGVILASHIVILVLKLLK